jgi:hypothetical protein
VQSEEFSLAQLQSWIQGVIVDRVPDADGITTADDVVNASKRLSAVSHINIYRHSYIARLRACMQTQFSALAYALGEELFTSFADQYLETCPSESYTLNTLGERFPAFLEQTRPDAGEAQKETWPDFMIEVAKFEYALSEVFDAKIDDDYAIFDDDTLDKMLKIAPSTRLFHHRFPVCNYYLDYTQGKKPELPFPHDSFCVVVRRDYKLGLFHIREAQYHFLQRMIEHNAVLSAKNDLVENFHCDRESLDAIWPQWKKFFIASGILVG